MLRLRASIRSMTGALRGCSTVVIFLPFLLFLDQALDILAVLVRELLRLERSRQVVNQALRQLKLLGGVFGFRSFALVGFVQFIRVIKRMKDQASFGGPDQHDVFTVMHGNFRDRILLGLFERAAMNSV